jgi:hypothetical protein
MVRFVPPLQLAQLDRTGAKQPYAVHAFNYTCRIRRLWSQMHKRFLAGLRELLWRRLG